MTKIKVIFLLCTIFLIQRNYGQFRFLYSEGRCSVCGKAVLIGNGGHLCRDSRNNYGQGLRNSANIVKEIPSSSGREFPQFGRWIDSNGNVTNNVENLFLRPVRERFADYFHQCLIRTPLKKVSENDIDNWKRLNIKKKNLASLKRNARGNLLKMMTELAEWEDFLCRIDAECYRYGVKTDSQNCIKSINALYEARNYYKWDNLLYSIKGNRTCFNEVFSKIELYAHSRMDLIDRIHEEEFLAWKADPQNRVEYMGRQMKVAQRDQEKYIKQLEKKVVKVEAAAEEANKKAASAEASAGAAANMAEQANRRAREAEFRAGQANERLRAHGINGAW